MQTLQNNEKQDEEIGNKEQTKTQLVYSISN
jgi:hypothetical protein